MGQTLAKNVIDDAIKQSISSSAYVALKATTTSSGENIAVLKNCVISGGTYNLTQDIMYTVDIHALQKALISQETQNKLSQDLQQVAETVAQNFDLNPSQKASLNALNLSAQIATDITSSISSSCALTNSYMNVATCEGSTITNGGVVNIAQKAYADLVLNCVQDATVHSAAYQEYVQNISQYAKTVVQNAIAVILGMIAVILLIIVGGPMLGLSNMLRNVLIFATLLLGLVFLDCYLLKLLCKDKSRPWIIGIAVTIYVLVMFAYIYNRVKAKKDQ